MGPRQSVSVHENSQDANMMSAPHLESGRVSAAQKPPRHLQPLALPQRASGDHWQQQQQQHAEAMHQQCELPGTSAVSNSSWHQQEDGRGHTTDSDPSAGRPHDELSRRGNLEDAADDLQDVNMRLQQVITKSLHRMYAASTVYGLKSAVLVCRKHSCYSLNWPIVFSLLAVHATQPRGPASKKYLRRRRFKMGPFQIRAGVNNMQCNQLCRTKSLYN